MKPAFRKKEVVNINNSLRAPSQFQLAAYIDVS